MSTRRRIDITEGIAALHHWRNLYQQGQDADRNTTATAVRYTLEELAAVAPGRSVEVRVPPYGATQAVAGSTHRRGTPPSVVDTDAQTWLELAIGALEWNAALDEGKLSASGLRTDLSDFLPLL